MPCASSWQSDKRVSEGVVVVWKGAELQIVGVRRRHENVVIFVAREITTSYVVDIWAPAEFVSLKVPPHHDLFRNRVSKTVEIPSAITKHL
jgi:hypothetical protein